MAEVIKQYTKYTLKDTFVNKIARCALKKQLKGFFFYVHMTAYYEIPLREKCHDFGGVHISVW